MWACRGGPRGAVGRRATITSTWSVMRIDADIAGSGEIGKCRRHQNDSSHCAPLRAAHRHNGSSIGRGKEESDADLEKLSTKRRRANRRGSGRIGKQVLSSATCSGLRLSYGEEVVGGSGPTCFMPRRIRAITRTASSAKMFQGGGKLGSTCRTRLDQGRRRGNTRFRWDCRRLAYSVARTSFWTTCVVTRLDVRNASKYGQAPESFS